jgi:hypothetical protein
MSNAIIRVHRPVLSPEERARRIEQIKKAAAQLIVATETEKRKEAHHE